jgi:uncharacterized protein (DUF362 family)/ferredoxin
MNQTALNRPSGQDQRVATLSIDGDIAGATQRAIALLGPMSTILAGRRIAILKPNFVAGRPDRTGATTNLNLIAAVAESIHAAGATPVLCEFPGTEFDFEATLTILGLEAFCQQHDIGLVRQVDRWLELRPAGARRLKRFRIPSLLADACLINLPVLKTHAVSGMSLAMKNLMGLLPRADRRTMHTFGIHQSIVDMNRGLRPDLSIVDGSIGQDGDGPLYGRPAHLGVLVAGRDSLSVDLVCCQLCKLDPLTIKHLHLALVQLGERHPEVVGDTLAVSRIFELPRVPWFYQLAFWLMYLLDYPFHQLTGHHLVTELYKTGLMGTRPRIVDSACTRCGDCVTACPLPNVINLETLRINPRTCERCMLCVEACPEGAIMIKGITGVRESARMAPSNAPGRSGSE